MKNRLHRWRIARSMDEGRPLPRSTVRALETDLELRRHRDVLSRLENDLRGEARDWHARQAPLERVPLAGLAPAARRPRPLVPRLLVAGAAAAVLLVTTVLVTRDRTADRPAPAEVASVDPAPVDVASDDVGTSDVTPLDVVPAVAAPTKTPWASLDRFAKRAGTLSLSGFRWAGSQVLVGEVRNVARDARRLADTLVSSVTFTGRRSG